MRVIVQEHIFILLIEFKSYFNHLYTYVRMTSDLHFYSFAFIILIGNARNFKKIF